MGVSCPLAKPKIPERRARNSPGPALRTVVRRAWSSGGWSYVESARGQRDGERSVGGALAWNRDWLIPLPRSGKRPNRSTHLLDLGIKKRLLP